MKTFEKIGIGLLLGVGLFASTRSVNADEKVHFIDLFGDAILLESDGHFGLIDGGEDSDNPTGNPLLAWFPGGEQILLNYLKSNIPADSNGQYNLDFIMGTHAHSDHLGGLRYVVNDSQITVNKAYLKEYHPEQMNLYNIMWDNQEEYDLLVSALNNEGIPIVKNTEELNQSFNLGKMNIQFYNTEVLDYAFLDESYKLDENHSSIVSVVQYNNKQIFLGGDLDFKTNPMNPLGDESRVASLIGDIDLMKLNHHGQILSNSYELISKLNPEFAISTWTGIDVYQPTKDYLLSQNIPLFETHYSGNIVIDFNKESFGLYDYTGSIPVAKPREPGWYLLEGNWYYFDGQISVTGWKSIGNTWYYFDSNGTMQKGWQAINGQWYLLDAINGDMKIGWHLDSSKKWYFLKASGEMTTGWQQVSGKWYFLKASGEMTTGWQLINGKWYFLNASGEMQTGRKIISGKWYQFNLSGEWIA
ncbi:MBL fold metallo-hydrolase [Enterococcus timonensis]|uniref:MBL fold metallo-hydrolase n=1 Tax=Enterococcus timonensis TaxID=1852364 RepID=UPI0008D9BE31|nr:MBL fold metallo-hydrolase [Enterococcus timonensis]